MASRKKIYWIVALAVAIAAAAGVLALWGHSAGSGPEAVSGNNEQQAAGRAETAATEASPSPLPASADSGSRTGGGSPSASGNPKLESSLQELADRSSAGGPGAGADYAAQRGLTLRDGRVTVVLESAGDTGAAAQAAGAAGGTVETSYNNLVQASVPVERLGGLAASPAVGYVREPEHPQVFATTDEGVSDIGASAWQNSGDTGAGMKIAVLDPGFSGYDQRIASGDLPANVTVRSFRADGDITGGGQVHGTACAEIVYDVAPGAQLYLVNFNTDVELGNAVNWLISQHVEVISTSFGFFSSFAGDGTGTIDSMTQQANAAGIFWADSSGNAAQTHWSGAFTDANGNNINDFAPGVEGDSFTASDGQMINTYLTWNGWPATNQDYDLYLYKSGSAAPVAASTNTQNGTQAPAEEIHYLVPAGQGGTYYVQIRKVNATGNATFQLYTYPYNLQYAVAAGSLGGQPSDSPYVMTVGAVPVYGTTLESFSSQGPTVDGRVKPDIVGPDRVSTATYGPQGFWGTSAAAPHVAGAAALVKSANQTYAPADIQNLLESRATDLGAPGKDNLYGSGKLNLGAAPPPPAGPSYYFTWYDESTPGMFDWILVDNTSTTAAVAEIFIGGQLKGTYQIAPGERVTPQFPGVMNGPVQVLSAGGQPLLVSQRVIFNGGFTELMALPGTSLASEQYLTWYDEQTPGMRTWLLIGNQGTQATTAEVYIHGVLSGTFSIQPGGRVTPEFPGVMDGPVYVRSVEGQPLVVSERVLNQGNFNEVMSVPKASLAGDYHFTWYDSRTPGMYTWVLAANPGSLPVTAKVYVGGQLMGSYDIPAGGRATPIYYGLMAGPVEVKSAGGEPLIVSERTLMGNSFEEVTGTPTVAIGTSADFTWYDQLTPGMTTWVLMSNQGTVDTSTSIYVGGVLQGIYTVPAGGTVKAVMFPGLMNGPVEVVSSGQPLMVSERTLYNSSFNEVVGTLP